MAGNITVKHYRFRNDDGNETTATWKGAEDAQIVQVVGGSDVNFRLRLKLENNTQAVTSTYGLKVSRNVGAPAQVGAASTYVKGRVSSNYSDADTPTEQMTRDGADSYTSLAGMVDVTSAVSQSLALNGFPVAAETEVEWSLVITAADVANGDTLDFTLFPISGAPNLTQFGSSVRITVQSSAPSEEGFLGGLENTVIVRAAPHPVLLPISQDDPGVLMQAVADETYDTGFTLHPLPPPRAILIPVIDQVEIPGSGSAQASISLKGWISAQNENIWVIARVCANAAFDLNLLSTQNPDTGPNYVVKQVASGTITVDGATPGYTQSAEMDVPWPAVGQLQLFGPAGILYDADVRLYYRRH